MALVLRAAMATRAVAIAPALQAALPSAYTLQSRSIKVYVRDVNNGVTLNEAKLIFGTYQRNKDTAKRRRNGRYFVTPSKQRQAAAANATFYKGVKDVERIMGKVVEDHKSLGFG